MIQSLGSRDRLLENAAYVQAELHLMIITLGCYARDCWSVKRQHRYLSFRHGMNSSLKQVRPTSVEFLAVSVYSCDCEHVVKEDIAGRAEVQ